MVSSFQMGQDSPFFDGKIALDGKSRWKNSSDYCFGVIIE